MIRRINLFGGPCSGKSSTATYIFSAFKTRSIPIEYVAEYAKIWAYQARKRTKYDQIFLFAKQIISEELVLANENKSIIVSDCPVHLTVIYAKRYQFPGWENLVQIANEFDKLYPAINIFLERINFNYDSTARFETKEEAIEIDHQIEEYLSNIEPKYTFNCINRQELLNFLLTEYHKSFLSTS